MDWSVTGLGEYKPQKNPVTPFHNSTAEIRSTPKAAVHCGNSWAFWREQGRLDRDSHQNPSPLSKKKNRRPCQSELNIAQRVYCTLPGYNV